MTSDDAARAVYRAFSPEPPTGDRFDEVYVDLDDVRGDASVVGELERAISLSDDTEFVCRLVAGHRGSGKTTELRRLARRLEIDRRYTVVTVPAEARIDLNDTDFPELLIAIVRELATQLEARFGIVLKPGYFVDRLARIRDLLTSDVELGTVGLAESFTKIGLAIKQSPEARHEIRKALEPDTSNLIVAANDLIGAIGVELRRRDLGPLVLIVDDVDKISMRLHERANVPMGEYLFVNRQPQLTAFECHVVYTIPLALAYSTKSAVLSQRYGAAPPVIPMIKIATRPPESVAHAPGLTRMRIMVERRLAQAGVREGDVFAQGTLERLLRASGGQPRELMQLVREALTRQGLPITPDGGLQAAMTAIGRTLRLGMTAGHEAIVDQVRDDGSLQRTPENERIVRELLENRAVLYYVNHDEWYAPNPLL